MTVPPSPAGLTSAVVDGVDVDAAATAVAACAGVSALDSGPYGDTVSYLPGRTVPGVAVRGGRVRVRVRSRWGIPAADVAAQVTAALAALAGPRPVDVVIGDIDDPPEEGLKVADAARPPAGRGRAASAARRPRPAPRLPPGLTA